jgi:hypothetical protein
VENYLLQLQKKKKQKGEIVHDYNEDIHDLVTKTQTLRKKKKHEVEIVQTDINRLKKHILNFESFKFFHIYLKWIMQDFFENIISNFVGRTLLKIASSALNAYIKKI